MLGETPGLGQTVVPDLYDHRNPLGTDPHIRLGDCTTFLAGEQNTLTRATTDVETAHTFGNELIDDRPDLPEIQRSVRMHRGKYGRH